MDPQDAIMPMDAALERKRQKTRRMRDLLRARQVALGEKDRERAMLMRKKQAVLAKEAAKQKVVDEFMVFIEAIEKNDMENAQNFDEKAMKNTILTMILNGDGDHSGDNGGFATYYGKKEA